MTKGINVLYNLNVRLKSWLESNKKKPTVIKLKPLTVKLHKTIIFRNKTSKVIKTNLQNHFMKCLNLTSLQLYPMNGYAWSWLELIWKVNELPPLSKLIRQIINEGNALTRVVFQASYMHMNMILKINTCCSCPWL